MIDAWQTTFLLQSNAGGGGGGRHPLTDRSQSHCEWSGESKERFSLIVDRFSFRRQ